MTGTTQHLTGRRRWPIRPRAALAPVALFAAATVLAACNSAAGTATGSTGGGSGTTELSVVAFQPPSLGAFLPAVIEKQGIDARHHLKIKFVYQTPDSYNSDFGAGHFEVGGSAAVLSEDLRTQRGAKVTYLFNLFDFWGTVVTSKSGVGKLSDLSGRTLAAATGTTNYAMFQWFAQQGGLDVKQVKTVNQTTTGLSTMALTGRTDAVQLWEPAYSTLLAKKPDLHTIDLDYGAWQQQFGTSHIPYLGVAAQADWAAKNPKIVKELYDTYLEASQWVTAHPQQAAQIIAQTIPGGSAEVIQQLIEHNDQRLRMRVAPASAVADGMRAVAKAGVQTGYLSKTPPDSVIYGQLK